jgi:hypothetical protein
LGLLSEDTDDTVPVPVVLVKVLEGIALTGVDKGTTLTLDQLVAQAAAPYSAPLQAVRSFAPSLLFNWSFVSVTIADIDALIIRATTEDSTYEAPKFDHFFDVVCTGGVDAGKLADALAAWSDVVEYAYVVATASDPVVTGTGNPFFANGQEDYLAAAPAGIGAAAAWAKGADGSGLVFIDIEHGWFLKHQDLPQSITLLQGANRPPSFAHGAGVLGEIVGVDNTVGIVGAAPAAVAEVVSYDDHVSGPREVQHVADRILNATSALAFGNVMLLEVHLGQGFPVETDPLAFEAIRLATKVGVIVVEVAGNGDVDLDTFVIDKGPHTRAIIHCRGARPPNSPNPARSWLAVHLGVSASTMERFELRKSDRLLCLGGKYRHQRLGFNQAQRNQRLLGRKPANNPERGGSGHLFWRHIGSVAIIGGCCLLVQSLRGILTPKSGTGKLGPFAMRSLLSDPNNGTASFLVTDQLGVMPDLAKIIANEFQP